VVDYSYPMSPKQETVEDIINSENELLASAEDRYGDYFKFAIEANDLLNSFLESVDGTRFIFTAFLSQVRKHTLLAIFSTVRLHRIQALMSIRQVLEAGSSAAYAIPNTDPKDFAEKDENGFLDASKRLAVKRYKWLEENHPDASRAIERQKGLINGSVSHANIVYAMQNFKARFDENKFETPFFDTEDELHIKGDLWMIGDIVWGLMDLFHGVNLKEGIIKFSPDFLERMSVLRAKDDELKKEMMESERFKNAMKLRSDSEKE